MIIMSFVYAFEPANKKERPADGCAWYLMNSVFLCYDKNGIEGLMDDIRCGGNYPDVVTTRLPTRAEGLWKPSDGKLRLLDESEMNLLKDAALRCQKNLNFL